MPRTAAQLVVLALLSLGCATALARSYDGDGDDWGSGWQQDTRGNWHGTGNNWGRGWTWDSQGNWHETGAIGARALMITPTTGARGLRSQTILAWICQGWKP